MIEERYIIERVKKGGKLVDRHAEQEKIKYFNQIYEQTRKDTLALITAKCGNLEDIQDIFQDTYAEIYSIISKKGVDYIKFPKAFTERIARQKIYRYYRWVDRMKERFVIKKEEEGETLDLADLAVDTFEIEEWMDEKEAKRKIESFLAKKSSEVQKIFYLFYYMDKTIEEIAGLMEISPSNVKNKIYRTIKEMRKLYQKEEVSL